MQLSLEVEKLKLFHLFYSISFIYDAHYYNDSSWCKYHFTPTFHRFITKGMVLIAILFHSPSLNKPDFYLSTISIQIYIFHLLSLVYFTYNLLFYDSLLSN